MGSRPSLRAEKEIFRQHLCILRNADGGLAQDAPNKAKNTDHDTINDQNLIIPDRMTVLGRLT